MIVLVCLLLSGDEVPTGLDAKTREKLLGVKGALDREREVIEAEVADFNSKYGSIPADDKAKIAEAQRRQREIEERGQKYRQELAAYRKQLSAAIDGEIASRDKRLEKTREEIGKLSDKLKDYQAALKDWAGLTEEARKKAHEAALGSLLTVFLEMFGLHKEKQLPTATADKIREIFRRRILRDKRLTKETTEKAGDFEEAAKTARREEVPMPDMTPYAVALAGKGKLEEGLNLATAHGGDRDAVLSAYGSYLIARDSLDDARRTAAQIADGAQRASALRMVSERQARLLLAKGDIDGAERLVTGPETVPDLCNAVIDARIARKDFDRAKKSASVFLPPRRARGWAAVAIAQLAAGDRKAAEATAQGILALGNSAIATNPNVDLDFENEGPLVANAILGKYDDAHALARRRFCEGRRACASDEGFARIAWVRMILGDPAGAEETARLSLRSPNGWKVGTPFAAIASVLLEQGTIAEALPHVVRTRLRLRAEMLSAFAAAQMRAGDFAAAERTLTDFPLADDDPAWERAKRGDPASILPNLWVRSMLLLADGHERAGRRGEALRILGIAARTALDPRVVALPKIASSLAALAAAQASLGDYDGANVTRERVILPAAAAWTSLAYQLSKEPIVVSPEARMRELTSERGTDMKLAGVGVFASDLKRLLSMVWQLENEMEGAPRQDKAPKYAPRTAHDHLKRAMVRHVRGDVKGELEDLTRAGELDPSLAEETSTMRRTICETVVGRAGIRLDGQTVSGLRKGSPADVAGVQIGDFVSLSLEALALALSGPAKIEITRAGARIAGFLLGEVPERQLLRESQSASAWFCAGMKRLLDGDRTAARFFFRECRSREGRDGRPHMRASRLLAEVARESSDPKFFDKRADDRYAKNDAWGVIACLTEAVDLQDTPWLHYRLGENYHRELGEYSRALHHYGICIAGEPKPLLALCMRGEVKHLLGDDEGALQDYARALSLNAGDSQSRLCLAVLHYDRGEWAKAVEELRRVSADNAYSVAPYPWLARAQLGERDAATQELTEYLRTHPDDEVLAARFLLDEISEKDLLASAEKPGFEWRRCSVAFFAGAKRLLSGDRAGAKALFQRSVDSEVRGFYGYASSVAALRTLQK